MNASEIIASLQSGDIDAGMLWEPYITQVSKEDGIEEVMDGTGLVEEVCGYVVNEEYLEENQEIVTAILKALDRAQQWSEENTEEAVSKIAEFSGSNEDEIQAIFDKSDGSTYITDKKIADIDDTAQYLYEQDLTSSLIRAEDIVNLDIQEQSDITAEGE